MATLWAHNEQLKAKIRYKSDPSENVINLSKHSFSLDTFKLLNKNLNFVPKPKKCNKKQLDTDAENFFRLYQTSSSLQGYQPKVQHRSRKPTLPDKK